MIKRLIGLLLLSLVLTACNDTNSDNNTGEPNEELDTVQEDEENSLESKDEAYFGDRTNPVPLNEAVIIDSTFSGGDNEYKAKVELTILEVLRGDEARTQFSEDLSYLPEKEIEYVFIKVKAKIVDSETENYTYSLDEGNFLISYDGQLTVPFPIIFSEQLYLNLYNGAEGTGYLGFEIKEGGDFLLVAALSDTPYFFEME